MDSWHHVFMPTEQSNGRDFFANDYPDFPTKSTFTRCIGREFAIAGFNEVGMAELDISSVNGSIGEKIWIEPKFLELISN